MSGKAEEAVVDIPPRERERLTVHISPEMSRIVRDLGRVRHETLGHTVTYALWLLAYLHDHQVAGWQFVLQNPVTRTERELVMPDVGDSEPVGVAQNVNAEVPPLSYDEHAVLMDQLRELSQKVEENSEAVRRAYEDFAALSTEQIAQRAAQLAKQQADTTRKGRSTPSRESSDSKDHVTT